MSNEKSSLFTETLLNMLGMPSDRQQEEACAEMAAHTETGARFGFPRVFFVDAVHRDGDEWKVISVGIGICGTCVALVESNHFELHAATHE